MDAEKAWYSKSRGFMLKMCQPAGSFERFSSLLYPGES